MVHSDVCGSAQILSIAGYRYYIVFVNDFTKYMWIYPLWLKSNVITVFDHFIKRIKNQFNKTIKQFSQIKMANTDAFINIVITWGITCLSCPYKSIQNGPAKRKHHQFMEMGLIVIAQHPFLLNICGKNLIQEYKLSMGY